jgi:hypothetical protein
MSELPIQQGGLRVLSSIVPSSSASTYGTHYSYLGVGGYVEVPNIEYRNSIPSDSNMNDEGYSTGRRRYGMLVYVIDDDKLFRLFPYSGSGVVSLETFTATTELAQVTMLSNNNGWVEVPDLSVLITGGTYFSGSSSIVLYDSTGGTVSITGITTTDVVNPGDGRVLVSTGNSESIFVAQPNMVFNGTNLSITGGTFITDSGGSLHSSAIIQFKSTTKGVLLPGMTTSQKNAIVNPTTGLTVYDSTIEDISVYTSSGWTGVIAERDDLQKVTERGNTTNRGLIISGTTYIVGSGSTSGSTAFSVQNSTGGTLFNLFNNGNLNVDSGVLYVDGDNGRVGIGTTSPTYKLQVGDFAINSSNKIVIATANAGVNGFYVYAGVSNYVRTAIEHDYGTSLTRFMGSYNTGTNIIGQDGNNGHTILYSGPSSSERVRVVGSNGNVLIGTTTDAGYKLEVNGTTRVNNTLRVVGSVGYGSNVFEFGVNGGTGQNGYINGFGQWFISNGGTNTTSAFVGGDILRFGQGSTSQAISFSNPNNVIGQWSGIPGTYNNTTTSETIIVVNNQASANLYGITIAGDQGAGQQGSKNLLTLSHWGSSGVQTFSNISSSQSYNLINVNISVSPTQPNKTLRGFYYNPTISGTTLANHNAIEVVIGNVLLGTTSGNVGIGTSTLGTATELTIGGSQTASSAIARGGLLNTSLSASSNNDVLVGLDINPTFTNGEFTGVSNIGIRVKGDDVNGGSGYSLYAYGGQAFIKGNWSIANGYNLIVQNRTGLDSLRVKGDGLTILEKLAVSDGTNKGFTVSYSGVGGYQFGLAVTDAGVAFTNGAAASRPVSFSMNTGEILRIHQNYTSIVTNNFLIGTTTDAGYKLDVNGTARVQDSLTVDTDTLYVDATNNRVGIGTTSPTGKLHIKGTGDVLLVDSTTTGSRATIKLTSDAASYTQLIGNGTEFNIATLSTTHITFGTNSSERLRIFASTGNVGINTTTDAGFKLDVNGSTRIVGDGSTSGSTILTLQNSLSATTAQFRSDGVFGISSASTFTTQGTVVISATSQNSGIAIVPNGTGAITAAIPDGTTVGGNARGQYAIDLQTRRTAATQVAGGLNSIVIGGANTAINGYSIAIGNNNIAGNDASGFSVAIGYNNNATPQYSTVIGYGCTSGDNGGVVIGNSNYAAGHSVAIGFGVSTGGYYAVGLGRSNTAGTDYSAVLGGQSNTTSTSTHATVIGGLSNTASGQYSIVGGQGNTSSASNSSILGGWLNINSGGSYGSIVGGRSNVLSTSSWYTFIGGGWNNGIINGDYSVVVGGFSNSATTQYAAVIGGSINRSSGLYSLTHGLGNTASSSGSTAIGYYNTASGGYSIAMGSGSTASGLHSTVSGGLSNTASSSYSTVVGGLSNTASGSYSIVGGNSNTASGAASVAFGTNSNISSGQASLTVGYSNQASGSWSVALGIYNQASATGAVALGGSGTGSAGTGGNTASGIGSFAVGQGSSSYLYGQNATAAYYFSSRGDAQQSLLTSRAVSATTSGSSITLSLDGTGVTNLITPYGNNRAWNVVVNTITVCTVVSGGTLTVGDAHSGEYKFLFKRVGGTSTISPITTSSEVADTSMGTASYTFSAGTSQQLAIVFNAPTTANNSTFRAVAKVALTEVAW